MLGCSFENVVENLGILQPLRFSLIDPPPNDFCPAVGWLRDDFGDCRRLANSARSKVRLNASSPANRAIKTFGSSSSLIASIIGRDIVNPCPPCTAASVIALGGTGEFTKLVKVVST